MGACGHVSMRPAIREAGNWKSESDRIDSGAPDPVTIDQHAHVHHATQTAKRSLNTGLRASSTREELEISRHDHSLSDTFLVLHAHLHASRTRKVSDSGDRRRKARNANRALCAKNARTQVLNNPATRSESQSHDRVKGRAK